jgi:hypothetical protein
MKKVIFIMLMACMACPIYAQTNDSSKAERKNELVVNLKSLHAHSHSPGGIMYRRNFKNVSLRVGLNGTYHNRLRSSTNTRTESYVVSPSLGIQKNVRLSDHFDFYWGGDLVYTYRESFRSDSTLERSKNMNSFGVSPFAGIRYSYKRLVLGFETSGNLSYRIQTQRENLSDPLGNPDNYHRESMNFSPFYNTRFFIGIKF